MFSRLRDYASTAFSRLSATPSTPAADEEPQENPIDQSVEQQMVTTRGGHDTDSPVVSSVQDKKGSKEQNKRKLEDSVLDSPATNAKRRKGGAAASLSAPKKTLEDEFHEIEQQSSHANTVANGHELRSGETTSETPQTTPKSTAKSGARKTIPTRPKAKAVVEVSPRKPVPASQEPIEILSDDDEEEDIDESAFLDNVAEHLGSDGLDLEPPENVGEPATASPSLATEQDARPKKIVFDEEGQAPDAPPVESNTDGQSNDEPESQSDSDDDEAPEVVTTASAQRAAFSAAASATEAIAQQEEATRLKRQARAEEQRTLKLEKEKREEKRAARQLTKKNKWLKKQDHADEDDDLDQDGIPDLLPASLLAVPQRAPSPVPFAVSTGLAQALVDKRNRHLKFIEHGAKPIKDIRKGPVSVRVLEQRNALMAPKMNRGRAHAREQWLKGRDPHGTGKSRKGKWAVESKMVRRSTGGGFLRR